MQPLRLNITRRHLLLLTGFISITALLYACGAGRAEQPINAMPPPSLPVLAVSATPGTTYREYTAALEGKVNVEIRPQVEGYLDKIYVDEGAYVKAGQPLFRINDRIYREALHNSESSLQAAEANAARARVEVDRLLPLVENKVISEVQLKTARATYDAALASAEQTRALVANAKINVGYTLVSAPVSGYIGRIPFKTGSLVGKGETTPLTVLSDVSEVYAYFSLSEADFIAFRNQFAGNTLEEKVRKVPAVQLVLADNSLYPQTGKIGTIDGQFDRTTGAISFRATFPNSGGLLRSGNTGRVRIPQLFNEALVVPQEATYEIQDKIFVYVVSDSNKVVGRPISISGKTANYYFVQGGLKAGERIVFSGLGNLRDEMVIAPMPIRVDSLLQVKPL
ncbi:MAG: efflux RND transporter periplasmic adaptor subunit [Candidatus Pseudobacter hemicellulosilyticus]|uniref:Efflux RND transporter periplasmic adaptor subunit n=1 Tax=Candidatus Pseudobacter hemicellulosilyticus TaxID=3121375 RepID=A0AAJ6BEN0_9BACT|nr:MAG: efflux RND transporter periplasmic adaptor subunit [Pseudobacter sp.]